MRYKTISLIMLSEISLSPALRVEAHNEVPYPSDGLEQVIKLLEDCTSQKSEEDNSHVSN